MKKLLLLAALFSTAANAALSSSNVTVEYTDKGSLVAIVCKGKADVHQYIKLAGNADTDGFKKFVQERMGAKHCEFLNSDATIEVLSHEPVFTANGPLWAINFRQKDVYGKYVYWWSSANYYPESYPRSGGWEMDLIHSEVSSTKAAE